MARDIKNTSYNVRLDLVNDPSTIKNEEGAMYFYNGKVYYLDGTNPAAQLLDSGNVVTTDAVNFGSTQWSMTLVAPQELANGDIANGFTFFTNADKVASGTTSYDELSIAGSGDHVVIPYVGTAYEGQRLQHNIRVNFGIVTGSAQTLGLSLRRFADNSIIGSEIKVTRDQDISGNQFNFVTYTAGASDPFVTGGFYFALRNDSGTAIEIEGSIGILIQTYYQKPTIF
jgi:hypothetical protein